MMDCKTVRLRLDDYLDHELSPAETEDINRHLEQCLTCERRICRARKVLSGLRQVPVPEADSGFGRRQFDRLYAHDESMRQRGLRNPFGWPMAAAAAAVVVTLAVGGLLVPWSGNDNADAPQVVTLHTDQEKEVRFAIRSERALDNVRLTVNIPENMELTGFPGQRKVSWTTQLNKGVNMLRLPIRASGPGRATLNMEVITSAGYHGKQALEMHVLGSQESRKQDGRDDPDDKEVI